MIFLPITANVILNTNHSQPPTEMIMRDKKITKTNKKLTGTNNTLETSTKPHLS